jgi:hypothetical protein
MLLITQIWSVSWKVYTINGQPIDLELANPDASVGDLSEALLKSKSSPKEVDGVKILGADSELTPDTLLDQDVKYTCVFLKDTEKGRLLRAVAALVENALVNVHLAQQDSDIARINKLNAERVALEAKKAKILEQNALKDPENVEQLKTRSLDLLERLESGIKEITVNLEKLEAVYVDFQNRIHAEEQFVRNIRFLLPELQLQSKPIEGMRHNLEVVHKGEVIGDVSLRTLDQIRIRGMKDEAVLFSMNPHLYETLKPSSISVISTVSAIEAYEAWVQSIGGTMSTVVYPHLIPAIRHFLS